ncbi:ABC transporter permease [Candidatus Saccharibacteria bacterium]|nr:ABC transporter permease [Candidatus Saccharibacteria bacterium]
MNLLDIIKSANHNLFRSKTRTFLTILAIFIGSFTIILNSAINAGVNSYIDSQVENIGGDDYIEIAPTALYDQLSSMMSSDSEVKEYKPDKNSGETAYITNEDLAKIREIDGIKKITPYHNVTAEYIESNLNDKKFSVLFRIFADSSLHADMLTGTQPSSDDNKPEIMLNPSYVEALGFSSAEDAVGKTVKFGIKQTAKCYITPDNCIATTEATITGVQANGVLSTGNMLGINQALSDDIYDLMTVDTPDNIKDRTMFATGTIDPDKIDNIRSELKKLGYTVTTIKDEVGLIRTFFDVILVVFNIFGVIALLAAAIGIINTLFMSVQERTREIGLEKALGMSKGKIFLSFSIEAILLGFWGSVVGIIFSMIIGYIGNTIAHNSFLADFPTFNLVKFDPLTMLTIVLVIMLIAFLAGTLPARKASKKNPIDALRYE